MVVEGGWSSAAAGGISSTPDKQARYITRHAQLLDSINARGLIQLLYADLDLASFPPPIPPKPAAIRQHRLTDSNFGRQTSAGSMGCVVRAPKGVVKALGAAGTSSPLAPSNR